MLFGVAAALVIGMHDPAELDAVRVGRPGRGAGGAPSEPAIPDEIDDPAR